VQDPLVPADVIVVLSGHMPYRALEAARLYQQEAAPQIWVSRPVGPVQELAEMQIPFVGEDFYSQRVLLATALCLALGVDFPFLWGLLAFFLNFVPNIGSVMASLPPILMALIQHGPGRALLVMLGYVVINMVIGNMLEPRLMGRRLGLSTLVVFLSLLFWGWVWGPIGMLLSVPLTVVLKILLEHSEDFRWLAVLLGPGGEPRARSNPAPDIAPPGAPEAPPGAP
jgi:hypothetical protein